MASFQNKSFSRFNPQLSPTKMIGYADIHRNTTENSFESSDTEVKNINTEEKI